MAIRAPGPRLLARLPFSFIKAGAGRKRPVDAPIALIPFIDLLITVVVFLLISFSASGEAGHLDELPTAQHGSELELAPVLMVDAHAVTLDGIRVADVHELGRGAELERVEGIVHGLEVARQNFEILHPHDRFDGRVLLVAGRETDYRVVRKVMFSAAQAGYGGVQLAVREASAN
ncbi:MAG: ExbD/TolR family protein [Sandaracinaceae bacterium]